MALEYGCSNCQVKMFRKDTPRDSMELKRSIYDMNTPNDDVMRSDSKT